MPPRKRNTAATTPAEREEEPVATEDEGKGQQADEASADDSPKPTPDDDKTPAPDGEKPARGDLQTVEQPCAECFPNGWPEDAFSVGCTHGTWVRDNA
jgi:hypothetical protein